MLYTQKITCDAMSSPREFEASGVQLTASTHSQKP